MSRHVTSVDGFKDLRSTSPRVCPPDPGHRASHSIQSEISGRKKKYTVKLHCVPSATLTAGGKEYEPARKRACDRVSFSKSFF